MASGVKAGGSFDDRLEGVSMGFGGEDDDPITMGSISH